LGRVQSKVTQGINNAIVVGRAQQRDRPRANFQIVVTSGDVEDRRRNGFASMTSQQRQGGAFARYGLTRVRLQPLSRDGNPALRIAFEQGLEHDDLKLARIVICGSFPFANTFAHSVKIKIEVEIEVVVFEGGLVFHFRLRFG